MVLGSIMAALSVSATPAPPIAQPPASSLAAIAGFCAPKQAFGIGFGSREVAGMHLSIVSSLMPLGPACRPFDTAEVVVTLHGRRRHTVHAQADFPSEGRAQDALEAIRAALIAQGWIAAQRTEVTPSTSLYSETGALDERHPSGRIADLFTLGTRLYFSCSDAAWKHRADLEMPPRPPQPPVQANAR